MKNPILLLMMLAIVSGCATYTTPGGGVSLAGIDRNAIKTAFSREPAAQFPASVVTVRVQASGYRSYSNRGYGQGNYTVVTTRDIETDEDFALLAASDGVARLAPMTRILLPEDLLSNAELRTGAAQLKADLLLMYTVDTSFGTEVGRIGPLQTVSLGFFPNRKGTISIGLRRISHGWIGSDEPKKAAISSRRRLAPAAVPS